MRMPKPWKHPKTGVYYFRQAVPEKLRDVLGWEIKFSLETKEPAEAKRRWPDALQEAKRRLGTAEGRITTVDPLAMRRRALDWMRNATATEKDREAFLNVYSVETDGHGDLVRPAEAQIPSVLLEAVFGTFDKASEVEARKAAAAALSAVMSDARTMEDALELWTKQRQRTAKVEGEWRKAISEFGLARHVDAISRTDVVEFRDRLLESDKGASTVVKYMSAVRTVLDCAVERGWCDRNVARDVKVAKGGTEREKRLPYEKEHLEAIFNGPVHAQGKRPQGGAGEAAYWLPILALYTGARLSELCQLQTEDVRDEQGVWYIEISDRGEGQSVKTAGSRRNVPLHSDICERFREFLQKGNGPIFPGLNAAAWSKWWGRYARNQLGIKDRRYVFHSFRHTFKDLCREADISKEVHDILTGHSSGDVGSSYGTRMVSVRLLSKAVEKINVGLQVA